MYSNYRDLVRENFSRAAPLYETKAELQEDVASLLLDFMDLAGIMPPAVVRNSWSRVLDTGCGTGRLVRKLSMKHRSLSFYGLDIAMPMLAEAIRKPGLRPSAQGFVNGACEALPFRRGTFGLVVSNLAYQWVSGLGQAFEEAARVLCPGGVFAFSTLGPDTLKELRASLTEADPGKKKFGFAPFASLDEITLALKTAGLENILLEKKTMTRTYDSPLHLLKTLKTTGASARGQLLGKTLADGTFLRKALQRYEDRFGRRGGGITATYEVILALAKKGSWEEERKGRTKTSPLFLKKE